jgi:DNA repair exonuclease SbcCD ATPase subunit
VRTNTGLTISLSDVLRELSKKQEQSDATVVECRNAVEFVRANLQVAKDRKQRAIYEDEQLKKKQKELIVYMNGLREKPQALIDEINAVAANQVETYVKRQAAAEIVRQRQRELAEADARLTLAENKQKDIQTRWKEISEQIQRVNNTTYKIAKL